MVQYLRPDSDVTSVTSGSFTAGLFRATTGTTGWETLDDVSPYGTGGRIYSDYGDDATYTCTLSNPSGTPASGTCTLTIRGGRGSGDATATSGGNNVVWNVDVSDDDFSTRITLTGNNGGIDEVYPNTEDTQSVRTWTFNTSAVSNWNNLKVRINVEPQAVDANARNIRIDAIELAVPPVAAASQYLRPTSDHSSSNVNTAPFWSKVDESVRDDADYISSVVNTDAFVRLNFSAPAGTPASGTCTFRVAGGQINKDGVIVNAITGNTVVLFADLYEGSTLLASNLLGTVPGDTTGNFINVDTTTFSTSLVSNWSNLSVSFRCVASGGSPTNRRGFVITWVEIEVPGDSNSRTASLSATLGATSLAATGKVKAKASLSKTLGDVVKWDRFARVSAQLGNVTGTLTAKVGAKGTLSATLGATSLSSQAFVGSPVRLKLSWARFEAPTPVYTAAYLSKALDPVTSVVTARAQAKASLSATLENFVGADIEARTLAKASLSASLGATALVATGKAKIGASLNKALDPVTITSTGVAWVEADASITLGAVTVAGTGKVQVKGQLSALLDDFGAYYGPRLQVTVGAATLTGHAIGLRAVRKLSASVGSLTLTGESVSTLAARTLPVLVGQLTLTGQNVGLLVAGGPLVVEEGGLFLTGENIGLRAVRKLSVSEGAATLTGQVVSLSHVRELVAASGSLVLTGHNVLLTTATRAIVFNVGGVTLSGSEVTLTRLGWNPVADTSEVWTPVSDEAEVWSAA